MRRLFVLITTTLIVSCGTGPESEPARSAPSPEAQPSDWSPTPSGAVLNANVAADDEQTVRQIIGEQGGSISATAADGSRYTLTIPERALVGPEEIRLTPVTAITGLPDGVTFAAGVKMEPEGLLLLEAATLLIEPQTRVRRDEEIVLGWSGSGAGVHAAPILLDTDDVRVVVTHFSGAAVVSGPAPAADAIIKGVPAPCAEQFFAGVAAAVRNARNGSATRAEVGEIFAKQSRAYVERALRPMLRAAEKDDALLPCAASEYLSWSRGAQLMLGSGFDTDFAQVSHELDESLSRGVANAFRQAQARCQRRDSPLRQLGAMIAYARQLAFGGRENLLPADASTSIEACGRSFDYVVDVESEMAIEYNEQGRGAGIQSSRTTIRASNIVAKYDESRSDGRDRFVFTSERTALEADASIVSRAGCPDQVRVAPDASISITVEPILNTRIGRLRCERGRVECDKVDPSPGVLLQLAPHVVESTFMHTRLRDKCDPVGYWNEAMMFFEGSQSTNAVAPFQVRGTQESITVVRRGTGVRRQKIDVAPQILAMSPGMKDYVEIRLPSIRRAVERTRVNVRERQH